MSAILKYGFAAALAAGSVLAVSAPAMAQGYHGGGHASASHAAYHGGGGYHGGYAGGHSYGAGYRGGYGRGGYGYGGYGYGGYGYGFGVGALAGLALGAAVAPGYGYYGGYGYGACYAPQQVWNPYAGGYVVEQVPYAC
jgi:hypothetical protein